MDTIELLKEVEELKKEVKILRHCQNCYESYFDEMELVCDKTDCPYHKIFIKEDK